MTVLLDTAAQTPTGAAALSPAALSAAAAAAVRAIPPVWPLASSVAVNPFLGQSGETLADAAARMARVAGIAVTMPREWYLERVIEGRITNADLSDALAAAPAGRRPESLEVLQAALERPAPAPVALPDIAELAAGATGTDWPGLIADRIGAWAAGYFDAGQALWAAPRGRSAWAAWRAVATHDLTPEIAGLDGFAERVADLPASADEAIAAAVARLGLPAEALPTYFHRLMTTLGGWGQVARWRLWEAELAGGTDATATELLAIRLVWEDALLALHGERIAERWAEVRAAHAEPLAPSDEQAIDAVLQAAAERAAERELAATFAAPAPRGGAARPAVQAAFCIDVRSEVFRRALEAVDPAIETLGFAGFFGLSVSHRRFASDVDEARCPVLLQTALATRSGDGSDRQATREETARLVARAKRAWGRFKLAAVSSFAFVEAMGPVYVAKLVRDALGTARRAAPDDPAPRPDPALDLAARTGAAETVLRAMSLTSGFARLVVLAGHGANVVNNPHESALHCGACGGYSGEVNARLLAGLLNDPEVRAGLAARGITVPEDTLFLGALHDTTTDEVTLYAADHPSAAHDADLKRFGSRLKQAGAVARAERAIRLPRARSADDVLRRSSDWSEVRPEWALAGCSAFIAAPRHRTQGRSLGGRAFLHSYEWRADKGFDVLELIMTAPVVVASWISLQYYGSTVAPQVFGSGNKLLHNVTGGIGVVEGNGGMLRAGLPWQSVHDGERLAHEPLRLSVVIEAPCEAMTDVLERHPGVRELFDNGWLNLFALDASGRMAWRYAGGLEWQSMGGRQNRSPRFAAAG